MTNPVTRPRDVGDSGVVVLRGVPVSGGQYVFRLPQRASRLIRLISELPSGGDPRAVRLGNPGGTNLLIFSPGEEEAGLALSQDPPRRRFVRVRFSPRGVVRLETRGVHADEDLQVGLVVDTDPAVVFPPEQVLLDACARAEGAMEALGGGSPVVLLRTLDVRSLVSATELYARHMDPFCDEFGDGSCWRLLPSAGAPGDNVLSCAAQVFRVVLGDPDLAARVEAAMAAGTDDEEVERG